MRWIVSTDVGGTKVATALVSSAGEIRGLCQEAVSQQGAAASLDQLVRLYQLTARQVRTGGEPVGWALAVPGIWDARQGRAWAPNIAGWDWIPLREALADRVAVPVFVESDRTAALLGEAWRGEGADCRDFLFLIVGTGIGLGALCSGKVIVGAHSVGGAVGWFLVPALFEEAKNPLTWEEAAAGPALSGRYRTQTGEARDAQAIFALAEQGEQAAVIAVRQVAVYLGIGISNLIAAFDPELIILGGGVSRGFQLMESTIRATIDTYAQPISSKRVRLAASRLGAEGPLLGLASAGFGELTVA